MDHWRVPYLGLGQIPPDLTAFELDIFFTSSPKEVELIDSRRSDLYRLALALHIGFVRMAGRTLDTSLMTKSVRSALQNLFYMPAELFSSR